MYFVRLIRGSHLQVGNIIRIKNDAPTYHNFYPDEYISAITHTEQIVDWIDKYFDIRILTKISMKTPCWKCWKYIHNAIYSDGNNQIPVFNLWKDRTIIGLHIDREDLINATRYCIHVFNSRNNTLGNFNQMQPQIKCYAIDNVSNYDGQLTMNNDGTVVECMENGTRYQRSADEPVLLSVTSKDITLDECESDNVQLSGIQKWWQEQREGHKAIRQWIEQNNNTVLQKLK